MEVAELAEPLEESKNIRLEGQQGTVEKQALDGRVLIKLSTAQAEDEFQLAHKKLGVVLDPTLRGVWVDLAKHDYAFDDGDG